MSIAFGHTAWIGFGEESTYGTPAVSYKYLEILEETLSYKQSYITKPALGRVSLKNKVKSKKSVEGSVKFQFPFDGAEKLLKHALGTGGTTGPTLGAYTHTFDPTTSLPTGLTFQVNRDASAIGGSSAFEYQGCQINKITFSQGMEDFLMCSVDLLGEDQQLIAQPAATFPAFVGVSYDQVTLAQVNGVTAAIEEFELTIENNLASDRYKLGSMIRKGLGRQQARRVSGKLTLELEQLTEYNYWRNLTEQSLRVTYTGPTAGSTTYSLDFNLPKVVFSGDEPTTKDAGPYKLTLNWEALQNAAANDELQVTLRNLTSAI
jgi:hypothetical protein